MKKVILVSGRMQSGKNAFADIIKEKYKASGKIVLMDLFAKGVKDGCNEDFLKLKGYLNTHVEQSKEMLDVLQSISKSHLSSYGIASNPIKENIYKLGVHLNKLSILDENWYEDKTDLTRTLLQTYGTEIFRHRVHNDYWINQTRDRIIDSDADVIIITDVRFPNEMDSLNLPKDFIVVPVRVERETVFSKNTHESETALDNYDFEYVIDNNGSMETLIESADALIECLENVNT